VIGGTATHHVMAALSETASRVSALKRTNAPEVLHAGA
jgi:hypothetical protein